MLIVEKYSVSTKSNRDFEKLCIVERGSNNSREAGIADGRGNEHRKVY
jgi:hypothetical protein